MLFLVGARLLPELTAVAAQQTVPRDDLIWARQAAGALTEPTQAPGRRPRRRHHAIDAEVLEKHGRWFRDAADEGIALNAARRSALQKKRRALATRMAARADDYPRFAHDLRVPFSSNQAEQVIRMSKLRIKVPGCMRSMHGAETFCAIRSNLATATRHGIGWLDALTRAAEGNPPIPDKSLVLSFGSGLGAGSACVYLIGGRGVREAAVRAR